MYAVFKTGGKQYRATTGDVIKVEKIEAEKGATVELDQVLMVGEGEDVKVGAPYLEGGKVPPRWSTTVVATKSRSSSSSAVSNIASRWDIASISPRLKSPALTPDRETKLGALTHGT